MKVNIQYLGDELTIIGDYTPEFLGNDIYAGESARFRIDEILIKDTKISVYDDLDAPGHLEELEIIIINEMS